MFLFMQPIERLDYDLLARPYNYLHNVNILVIKLSIFNESYYLVVGSWQDRDATSGWRLTPISVVCQLIDEAAPLGASLSGFAVPVGVTAGRELLHSVCRSRAAVPDDRLGIILYSYTNLARSASPIDNL